MSLPERLRSASAAEFERERLRERTLLGLTALGHRASNSGDRLMLACEHALPNALVCRCEKQRAGLAAQLRRFRKCGSWCREGGRSAWVRADRGFVTGSSVRVISIPVEFREQKYRMK